MTPRAHAPNDPALRAFVEVAAGSHFPIQNLPYGSFSTGERKTRRIGVAIGEYVLDLAVLEEANLLGAPQGEPRVFDRDDINAFLALGPARWASVRRRISELLRHDTAVLRDDAALRRRALVPRKNVSLHLPLAVAGYTDFYSSKEHATNAGRIFRGAEHALSPNWLEMPIAYNGRASSVVASGTPVRRPNGQTKSADALRPSFGPTRKLDFELETAFVVGRGNDLGRPISVADAERHIFGLVLLNDWSARDLQQWESAPLGPFNAKSFATSISPWIVTLEALEPFRVPGPAQLPEPLPYLRSSRRAAFDIALQVTLFPSGGSTPAILTRSNAKYLYWSVAQQLAHHTVSGCNAKLGDLVGSGTISGPGPGACGCLLELSWNGTKPIVLPAGDRRTFLEDGDEVVMTGWCRAASHRVGFGELSGRILPAPASD